MLFAVLLTVLLGLIAFLYSLGFVFAARRTVQTAADAASLAGAWQVLMQLGSGDNLEPPVRDAVFQYAQANGVAAPAGVAAAYADGNGADLVPAAAVGSGATFPAAARGVRVTGENSTGTLLPGFLGGISNVRTAATAVAVAAAVASPASMPGILPVAVNVQDFRQAFDNGLAYDLLAPTTPPFGGPSTLDLTSIGGQDYGALNTNVQYWSDGGHANGTAAVGGSVALAGSAQADAVVTGLRDNIRRQAPADPTPNARALVMVALWDTAADPAPAPGPRTVRVVGFAQLRVRRGDLTATSAPGVFVPYPAGAWLPGAPPPAVDVGARVVRIIS